jgi:uncharacterized protein (DUF58 family)
MLRTERNTQEHRFELTLLGRLAIILASLAFLAGWMTDSEPARLAAALLAAAPLVDFLWKRGRLPPLEVLLAPRRTIAGERFAERLVVRNGSARRACRDLSLREPQTATIAGGALLERLAAGGELSLALPARVRRRGRLPRRRFLVETAHPLGMLRSRALVSTASELVCEPARVRLPAEMIEAAERFQADHQVSHRAGDARFHALREYAPGEDARLVHALKSASAGVLVRKVNRDEDVREACLVLDLRRPPAWGLFGSSPHFEWGLGATATLIDRTLARHGRLVCIVLGQPEATWTVGNEPDAHALLAFLAEARPRRFAPAPPALVERMASFAICYWVAAGGHRNAEERAGLERAILVEETPQ